MLETSVSLQRYSIMRGVGVYFVDVIQNTNHYCMLHRISFLAQVVLIHQVIGQYGWPLLKPEDHTLYLDLDCPKIEVPVHRE